MSKPYDCAVREEAVQSRLAGHRFSPAVAKADRGEIGPLCAYLRSKAPLDPKHREDLAHLIERRIGPKGPGRLPDWPTPRTEVKGLWVAWVNLDAKRWRTKNPDHELPHDGWLIKRIEKWGGVLAENGELHRITPEITAEEILKEVRRGPKRKTPRRKFAPMP